MLRIAYPNAWPIVMTFSLTLLTPPPCPPAPPSSFGCLTAKPYLRASASSTSAPSFAKSTFSEASANRPPFDHERKDDSSERGEAIVSAKIPRSFFWRTAAASARELFPQRGSVVPVHAAGAAAQKETSRGAAAAGGAGEDRIARAVRVLIQSEAARAFLSVAHWEERGLAPLNESAEHSLSERQSSSALPHRRPLQRTWHAQRSAESARPGHAKSPSPPPACASPWKRNRIPSRPGSKALEFVSEETGNAALEGSCHCRRAWRCLAQRRWL